MKVTERNFGFWTEYVEEGYGLTIDSFTHEGAGYVRSWTLCSSTNTWTGTSIPELMEVFKELCKAYQLQFHDTKLPYKDVLVVYVKNINQAYGFLYNYGVNDDFIKYSKSEGISDIVYFQILHHIEIRPCWYKKEEIEDWDAKDLADYGTMMWQLFLKDKYSYITSNQIIRKRTEKLKRKYEDDTAKKIYPLSYDSYKLLKKAFFGGIIYAPYPGVVIPDAVVIADAKSDYYYQLLMRKHVMDKKKKVDPANWELYLSTDSVSSYGKYKIKYTSYTNKISAFKNYDEEPCRKGEDIEDTFVFTATDLKLFLDHAQVQSIECEWLYTYEMDDLPEYMRETYVREYLEKERLQGKERRLQKEVVNGGYGNCCRNWTTEEEFLSDKKDPTFAPQWGIWCTSYARKHLLDLGDQLDGWYYGVTDSVCFKYTEENMQILEEYNSKIRARTKKFCDKYGYDYEELKDLGCFIVEHITLPKHFKVFCPNSYMYTEIKDGEEVTTIKASGCNKKDLKNLSEDKKKELYKADHIPAGTLIRNGFNPNRTHCTIDGIRYESNGSWYEKVINEKYSDFYILVEMAVQQAIKQ